MYWMKVNQIFRSDKRTSFVKIIMNSRLVDSLIYGCFISWCSIHFILITTDNDATDTDSLKVV